MWPFRRRVADSTPISDSLWQSACARAEVLSALSSAQARKLRQLAAEFLARKHITTVHGLELAPSDRALIACLCCLPVLNLGGHWLGGWREVVVYPGAFRVRRQELEESSGVLHEWDEELAGEAWSEGPLILSWQDLLDDLAEPDSGCNVIAHEIAHKLDPNEVNWLWKLIGEAAGVFPREVKAALEGASNPLPLNRVKAWAYGEQNPSRSAMNLTELVTVLEALIQHRAKSKDVESLQPLGRPGMLSEEDMDRVDLLVSDMLEKYSRGQCSREQAVNEISHLIAAIDDREVDEVRQGLRLRSAR